MNKQKRLYQFIAIILFYSPLFSAWAAEPTPVLRFAPLPLMSEHHVKEQFLDFCCSLGHLTNRQVKLVYKTDYEEILSALHNDELDLAYLGPLPYVIARHRDEHIVPVVRFLNKEGNSQYTCSLVTFGQDQLEDLPENAAIALPQRYSTCGYLLMADLQSNNHENPRTFNYSYLGNHEQTALSVIRGQAFLGGVKTTVARQFENLGLTVVQQSPPLPGFLLVANQRTLGAETVHQLKQDLLALSHHPTEHQKQCLQNWGEMICYGMTEALDEDYQSIRSLMARFPIEEMTQ